MTDNEVLTAIRQECHNLDKRLAVVETRQEMQDHRIESIETTAHEILVMLRTHVEQEAKDRLKIMGALVAVLLSIIGFAVTVLTNHLMK